MYGQIFYKVFFKYNFEVNKMYVASEIYGKMDIDMISVQFCEKI
jgi:hypothetical protein